MSDAVSARRVSLCIEVKSSFSRGAPDQVTVMTATCAPSATACNLILGAEASAGIGTNRRGLIERLGVVTLAHLWPLRITPHQTTLVPTPRLGELRLGATANLVKLSTR